MFWKTRVNLRDLEFTLGFIEVLLGFRVWAALKSLNKLVKKLETKALRVRAGVPPAVQQLPEPDRFVWRIIKLL